MNIKQYNFNELIDRKGTNCLKTDLLNERFGNPDLLPMWVADMDFRTPDFIIEALSQRLQHPIFGYTFPPQDYYSAIIQWVEYKHKLSLNQQWLTYIPGIVKGLSFAIDCFSSPGDQIIIQPPVYHPFRIVPEMLNRTILNNPLTLTKEGKYQMNLDHLESIITPKTKILILCSPHNPGGIVWDQATLHQLADLCTRKNILILSDEIHSETSYPQYIHHAFPTISDNAANNSITFMSPSKTFNIAGLVTSYAIVPNDALRAQFFHYLQARELNEGTIFAYEATKAAYTHGAEWLRQLSMYIIENVNFAIEYLEDHLPQITPYTPQASFLLWLDCRNLNLSHQALVSLFKDKARLALNDGTMFGPGGEGHMRMNIGCPRTTLETALTQLKRAIQTNP